MVMKACPSCSAYVETEKSFCPECGTSYVQPILPGPAPAVHGGRPGNLVSVLAGFGIGAWVLQVLVLTNSQNVTVWEAVKHKSGWYAMFNPDDFYWNWHFRIVEILSGPVALIVPVLILIVAMSERKPSRQLR